MSSDEVMLSVRGLSKSYRLGTARQSTTLAEALAQRLRQPLRRSPSRETFWALKDVSFDICRGDVVGVIGRNGAGKSTLLKVISRITEPTDGEVRLYGRVGSLLEVGSGFHGELTGRENIFLNGAILGMRREEIRRRFDEIVSFAGVEQFLDTPVKHYSSGMYVRLAFAVAAHLEPEILVVDEVLAVGDLEFQERCLGRIRAIAGEGRTVMFVSHNLQTVSLLCQKGIVLRGGRLVVAGDSRQAITEYLTDDPPPLSASCDVDRRPGSGEYRIVHAAPGSPSYDPAEPKEVVVRIERRSAKPASYYLSGLLIDPLGHTLLQFDSRLVGVSLPDAHSTEGRLVLRGPWLKPGNYRLDLYICSAGSQPIVDKFEEACVIRISPLMPYAYPVPTDAIQRGAVLADFEWCL